MPYDTLPARLQRIIPSSHGQRLFRNVLNAQLAAGKTEEVAFASAWAALQRNGFERNAAGKWIKKVQPTAAQVHVPGTMDDEDEMDDSEDDMEDKGNKPMKKASGAAPVYMYRSVLNAEQIIEWAALQGFSSTLPPDDMHVTVVFSRAAFDADISRTAEVNGIVTHNNIVIRGGRRVVTPLGDKGAVVLKIESLHLQGEHAYFREMGASWDYQEYTPHISITYAGEDVDVSSMQPFMGDIVLGPLRAKPLNPAWDGDVEEVPVGKAATYQPPASARNNAKRVLRWREEHGSDVKGMTSVGWARARQLASGKPIGRDTVARMSAFNRHRKNAAVAPEYKSEPWKDAGYVAWLGWGGTTGIDWARSIMEGLNKRSLNDDMFTTAAEAAARSMDLGLNGEVHVHETADGMAVYMPGAEHEDYLERMAELAGLEYEGEDEEEDSEDEGEGLLERVIGSMVSAAMSYEMDKAAAILKVDAPRRIVWGWASVSTVNGNLVTDLQGDTITPTEMSKMADRFMRSARAAKAMHDGDDVGEVVHSFPLTKELADAFGITTDREGWITGTYIKSDEEWAKVLRGDYKGLSIGGKAKRTPK